MKIGPFIRKMFGSYERDVSAAYRSLYLDVDAFVELVRRWNPTAQRILEVGCGEGAISERLCAAYPGAKIIAIDVTSSIGRLYQGPVNGVRFIQCEVQEIPAAESELFDLVVLCDVLHHVPAHARIVLLNSIRARLAPGGSFIFKDWERSYTPIHWLCYTSDRWLTGDRISYTTREEMRRYLAASFGEASLAAETRVGPHWNNLAIWVRPPQSASQA
jgi:2-polyprenyl-3-methyl-5-hydroxy-6-metoxy-1,4-benzoquinol methylase